MGVQQAIDLTGHVAWPFVALIALLVLRPYISQVTRAAADLRELLNRSGEMANLAGQVAAIREATEELRAMQQVAQAGRPDLPASSGQADLEQLWKQLEKQWQETRDAFRSVAQAAGVRVNFAGSVGVRDAAKALVDLGRISEQTATAMADLSSQYQYMWRTTTERSEYLNQNVVAAFTTTATRVRQALKTLS